MKFRCERDVLLDALTTAGRAVSSRGGSLPVLSGLLVAQEKDVLAAHRAVGLELAFRIRQNDWSVLVLQKAGRTVKKTAARKTAVKRISVKKIAAKKIARKA